jgi:hypothetical protein
MLKMIISFILGVVIGVLATIAHYELLTDDADEQPAASQQD